MNTPTSSQASPVWHSMDKNALMEQLASSEKGLTPAEVKRRMAEFGPNQLPQAEPPTWWLILIRQFQSPFVYILGVAAALSLILGEYIDAGFIFGVLCLNAAIGGFQEWKAEKSAKALQQLLQIRATVEREGHILEISAEEVVPGDIVWLESGNRIPADMRLLSAHGLEVDESLLTGESLSVLKDSSWCEKMDVPVGDRLNMGYAGSIVVRGRGRGMVAETGMNTEVGRLAHSMMGADEGKPPLMVRLERFSSRLAWVVMLSIGMVAALGIVFQGYSLVEMFMFSVALAVAVIPEGLPVALTIALAIGTTRMARRGVIVRRLAAVEGLGSCTLIASDKTGTLTCNELTVRELFLPDGTSVQITGQGFRPEGNLLQNGTEMKHTPALLQLLRAAVLCNEADLHRVDGEWVFRGDPTDIALLSLGEKAGTVREEVLHEWAQVNQIPFEPEYQYSATFHQSREGESRVFVKGSPERVLAMCDPDFQSQAADHYHKLAEDMAVRGYRVLALAEGAAPANLDQKHAPPEPNNLTLLGLVGMIDPLRAGVRESIASCHEAGIKVAMVTGDHPVTAMAIAHDLGLNVTTDQVVTGSQLESKSEAEMEAIVKTARVFARVAPHQKLALVKAMQRAGNFVAVTGDGVNDAPALRTANIGAAMGKSGTDVAREAAELVISDDNFVTIVGGVEEGRIAYNNIRKIIFMLVSTGAAEVVLVMVSVVLGLPLPLTPAQLLWLNLVTQGIQDVGMGFEPGEGDELKQKPRDPQETIFNRLMIERSLIVAVWIGVLGFILFYEMLQLEFPLEETRNALLLLMVVFINVHIFNCRSETKSAFSIPLGRNRFLAFGVLGAFLAHVLAMHLPAGQLILKTQPVGAGLWALVLGMAASIVVLMEWHKRWWNRRHGIEV